MSKIEKRVRIIAPCRSRIVKFLLDDWFLRQTTNTKGKERGSVLSSPLWRGALRDDTKNGYVADYSSKGKWVSSVLKTMLSEIRFPMTLICGAFLNQKRNKQSSHELQKNLESNCISFCASRRKSQLKTSQDDTKLCYLQLWVNKSPDAA